MKQKDNYLKYRGKCKEFSEQLCINNPQLRIVRGYYYCPILNTEEGHWWCVDKEGNIHDPTKLQFPSAGNGEYREFNGLCVCAECGREFKEDDPKARFYSSYAFCTYTCNCKFIGIL